MTSTSDRTREWARLGAKARLLEIDQERAAILREYPDLGRSGPVRTATGRSRPKLTPAAKRRLSAGMRKYWARRKALAAAKAKA